MTELIAIEKLKASEIFSQDEADKIINQIKEKVAETKPDISTAKGRKELSTLAAKIAKSKVLIDELGKNLVAGWKTQAKEVDVVRKKIRDELDELKAETRAPLTEWEQAEKDRVANLEKELDEVRNAGTYTRDGWDTIPLEAMKDRLTEVKDIIICRS